MSHRTTVKYAKPRRQQVKLGIIGCILAMIYCIPVRGHVRTVKTNHTDVNLRSGAGSETTKLGQVRKFEEIQVLQTKLKPNGETWLQVQLLRYPDGNKVETIGWVAAKYFTDIETPTKDDQPPESSTEATVGCVDCIPKPTRRPSPSLEIADIRKNLKNSKSFVWPVGGSVRSGFGYRKHPIKGVVKLHRGTDISGNAGAQVKAAKSGTVEVSAGGCRVGKRSCNGGAGNMVTINHGDGTKTRYFHLSSKCKLPKRGTRISQNATLGCVGSTGAVTGPHLHFELIQNGKWINPLKFLPKRN